MFSRILLLIFFLKTGLTVATATTGTEFSITTAPFEISRKYKSMEGPQVIVPVSIDLLQAEGGSIDLPVAATDENPLVWIRDHTTQNSSASPELWWFTGAKLEAIHARTDEVISEEFICHLNIDIDRDAREKFFPESPGGSSRLLTLTGGATDFHLPTGFGVPMTGSEPLMIYFQALNHNRNGTHVFRHRLTLQFVKDSDLTGSITPLAFHWPSIAVPLESENASRTVSVDTCSCCSPATAGENAPANSENGLFTGPEGRIFSGHWIIPHGFSEWSFPVNYYSPDFASYDTTIHALIPHLHPFAEKLDLIVYRNGCEEGETLAELKVESGDDGVGLKKIDTLISNDGLPISAEDEFELRVSYLNRSSERQDSMATLGIFSRDLRWKRPAWADAFFGGEPPTCGVLPPPR